MFKSMIRRVSVIISSVLIFFLSASAGTDDDESTIRAILLARFGRLHNVIVDYSVTEHLPIPPDMRPEDVVTETGLLITGTRVRQEQFSLLGDLFFYSYSVQSWEPAVDDPALSRMLLDDGKTHILTPSRAGPERHQTIESLRELVSLYESWNKPEQAAKWRGRVPRD
jgi:hypothetical protein